MSNIASFSFLNENWNMELKPRPTIKKSDMGLAGAIIVLAQALTSFKSTRDVSSEIQKLRDDIQKVRSDHEQYFVKKEELKHLVVKLDKMNKHLSQLNEKITSLKDGYTIYRITKGN